MGCWNDTSRVFPNFSWGCHDEHLKSVRRNSKPHQAQWLIYKYGSMTMITLDVYPFTWDKIKFFRLKKYPCVSTNTSLRFVIVLQIPTHWCNQKGVNSKGYLQFQNFMYFVVFSCKKVNTQVVILEIYQVLLRFSVHRIDNLKISLYSTLYKITTNIGRKKLSIEQAIAYALTQSPLSPHFVWNTSWKLTLSSEKNRLKNSSARICIKIKYIYIYKSEWPIQSSRWNPIRI